MPEGKKSSRMATIITFLVSALWHGFYPGYYLAFLIAAFNSNCSRTIYRAFHPFYNNPKIFGHFNFFFKILYSAIGITVTSACLAFEIAPFVLLNFSETLQVWSIFYYYIIVGIVALSLFFDVFGGTKTFKKINMKINPVDTKDTETSKKKIE
ncbi:Lysophospholipid acyltransferase [Smittium culicis]|uniref:Lysophospholipid acyltransferase n=1 Tax=Smittium culicis TaxID=133412 RepID=A0A1R1Y271_9FUNG|nr:Lysophospholipid acyltransferase [Smittium culicis]